MCSSEPEARMFVSCLPLQGLTVMSSPFDVSPITIPSYTSIAGPMNKRPRSCKFQSEKPRDLPVIMEVIEPVSRFSMSPTCSLNPTKRLDIMPSPFVSIVNTFL